RGGGRRTGLGSGAVGDEQLAELLVDAHSGEDIVDARVVGGTSLGVRGGGQGRSGPGAVEGGRPEGAAGEGGQGVVCAHHVLLSRAGSAGWWRRSAGTRAPRRRRSLRGSPPPRAWRGCAWCRRACRSSRQIG